MIFGARSCVMTYPEERCGPGVRATRAASPFSPLPKPVCMIGTNRTPNEHMRSAYRKKKGPFKRDLTILKKELRSPKKKKKQQSSLVPPPSSPSVPPLVKVHTL